MTFTASFANRDSEDWDSGSFMSCGQLAGNCVGELKVVCGPKMSAKNGGTNLHAGSKSDLPDLDQMIDANPCSKVYLALEDCLVETNRSWQKCQQQVS
jgi:hypothetical protein